MLRIIALVEGVVIHRHVLSKGEAADAPEDLARRLVMAKAARLDDGPPVEPPAHDPPVIESAAIQGRESAAMPMDAKARARRA